MHAEHTPRYDLLLTYRLHLVLLAVALLYLSGCSPADANTTHPSARATFEAAFVADPVDPEQINGMQAALSLPEGTENQFLHDREQYEHFEELLQQLEQAHQGGIDRAEAETWLSQLQNAAVSLGLAETLITPRVITQSSIERSLTSVAASYNCATGELRYNNSPLANQGEGTTQLEFMNAAIYLWTTAHENVHLQLQQCIKIDITSAQRATQQLAMIESSAQLLALESLAYLFYNSQSSQTRATAQAAFFYGLSQTYRQAERYHLLTGPDTPERRQRNVYDVMGASQRVGEYILDGYAYGALPVTVLESGTGLAANESLRHTFDHPISLEYTERLLGEVDR